MSCTRCDGSGFLNLEQMDAPGDHERILSWMRENDDHDVSVCDCCGDGERWYGTPGEHYGPDDPAGESGPYAYNGGLCECH